MPEFPFLYPLVRNYLFSKEYFRPISIPTLVSFLTLYVNVYVDDVITIAPDPLQLKEIIDRNFGRTWNL